MRKRLNEKRDESYLNSFIFIYTYKRRDRITIVCVCSMLYLSNQNEITN